MSVPQTETWIFCIAGYMQQFDSPIGMSRLESEMHAEYAGAQTRIVACEWNRDWKVVAEWVRRVSVEKPTIIIFAYSWGVGHGFVQLSKRLRDRGLLVDAAVLCDGVRHARVPGYAQAAAYMPWLPWSQISVPDNVCEVWWHRQKNSRLRGHDVVKEGGSTYIHRPVIDNMRDHTAMDESPDWRAKCKEVAQKFVALGGEL